MRTEKVDIYSKIANQIIEAIEAGADNYCMPWHVNGADSVLPVNASTHRPYRGVNILMLWEVAAVPGSTFTSARGINDSGQVVGYYYDENNSLLGYLATGPSFGWRMHLACCYSRKNSRTLYLANRERMLDRPRIHSSPFVGAECVRRTHP